MRVFALYNIKGGVGKTASAVNLAWLSAQEGARTLVWDLDPQGAATFYFRVKPKVKGGHTRVVNRPKKIDSQIKGTDYENLDLLPADFSYRHMDLALDDTKKPTRQFRRLIKPLAKEYDTLFIDCPPSISLVSENVFDATQVLLIPMIPTTLSVRTVDQIADFCARHGLKKMKRYTFCTMLDRRKNLHREIVAELRAQPETLRTTIPYSADVERMGLRRAPLATYAPNSPSAIAYAALWQEISARTS